MAYRAEIQIGVVGIGQLGTLQKSLNQVATTVDTLNKKRIDAGFNVQNINTYNAQLEKAVTNVNKAAMGSKEELEAVENLVKAKQNQIAAQERLNQLIAKEEASQRRIVATANAGVGPQGPKLPPAMGGGFTPKKGLQAPGTLDAILGGGFPLLFGGGPGAVGGGALGGLIGGKMGGLAGMALSIGLSAIGQLIDQAVIQVKKLGDSLNALSIDALRESFITVNAELTTTVRRLIEAGNLEEARATIAEEIARQTGVLPAALQQVNESTSRLNTSFNQYTASVSVLIGLLARPLIDALAAALRIVSNIVFALNLVISTAIQLKTSIQDALPKPVQEALTTLFLILNPLASIQSLTGTINEEEQKLVAELTKATDQYAAQIALGNQLLALDSQRTLGRTDAEKIINEQLDNQAKLLQINEDFRNRELALRQEYAGITSAAGQQELDLALAQLEALKQQEIKKVRIQELLQIEAQLLAQNKNYYEQISQQLQVEIERVGLLQQLNTSRLSVAAAFNQLETAALNRQFQLADTEQQRYLIALKLFDQQVKAAKIEFLQAVETAKATAAKVELEVALTKVKLAQLEAEKDIAVASAKARGNTEEQIAAIVAGYDKALTSQEAAVDLSKEQAGVVTETALNQVKVADAVFKTKVIQAESELAQRLVSKEIGLSKANADRLAGSLGASVVNSNNLTKALTQVAAQAAKAAAQLDRIYNRQPRAVAPVKPAAAAEGAYWKGGFKAFAKGGVVTQPTLGLIGEGGEAEYIVPQSKVRGFVANWLQGRRGKDAIDLAASGEPTTFGAVTSRANTTFTPPASSVSGPINIQTGPVVQMEGKKYVTLDDMQVALQSMASAIFSSSRASGTRRYTGVR